MTGRRAGYCAGYGAPGSVVGTGYGWGFGPGRSRGGGAFGWGGRGRGRGWRNRSYPGSFAAWNPAGGDPQAFRPSDPETEQQSLKAQAENLQSELDLIRKRLGELESGSN